MSPLYLQYIINNNNVKHKNSIATHPRAIPPRSVVYYFDWCRAAQA